MVILNSTKEELHRFFSLLANTSSQPTPFVVLTKPAYVWSPAGLLEYTIAASDTLFEEDGVI